MKITATLTEEDIRLLTIVAEYLLENDSQRFHNYFTEKFYTIPVRQREDLYDSIMEIFKKMSEFL